MAETAQVETRKVIEAASYLAPNMAEGLIVIGSTAKNPQTATHELLQREVRQMACRYAHEKGMENPGVSGTPRGPYPVNAKGVSLDQVKGPDGQLPPKDHPDMQIAEWRIDVPIVRRLV